MHELPEEYCNTMQTLLGEEYSAYLQSLEQPAHASIRINTHKIAPERWKEIGLYAETPVSWTDKGWYYDSANVYPSKHPYYFAGLYYIQEASAMIPASILPVRAGDRVLDLCAAPGGKATELAAKLQGKGLLVANDISVSRAMALAKNLQMAGTANALVTAETPERLAEYFPDYFDAVLVDAPCSGEGMFRRDPRMKKDWLTHGPAYYAEIQRTILRAAYRMLRPGGFLVYSTCTFSPIEDEAMAGWLLQEYPDLQVCPVPHRQGYVAGRPEWAGRYQTESLQHAVRIFPHRAQGEGHFAILMQKQEHSRECDENHSVEEHSREHGTNHFVKEHSREHGTNRFAEECHSRKHGEQRVAQRNVRYSKKQRPGISGDPLEVAASWLERLCPVQGMVLSSYRERLWRNRDQIVFLPEGAPDVSGLRMIQNGLIVGTVKRGRFEPSPQMALAARSMRYVPMVSLAADDVRVIKYLKGETISLGEAETKETDGTVSIDVGIYHMDEETLRQADGYLLVCVDGYPLGWAKWTKQGNLKNKYYAGWRLQ